MYKNSKDHAPFYSVIVPVYQCGDTLQRCLDSVLTQNEESFEIILIDDGSKDKSGEICDTYEARFPGKVQVLHKRNEGPLAARLDGIQRSSGRYVMFLDADDRYADGIFQKLNSALEATHADMIIFNHIRVAEDGAESFNVPLYQNGQTFEGTALSRLYQDALEGPYLNALWQKCVRRDLLRDAEKLRKFGRLMLGEDKLLSLQIIENSEKTVYLSEGLYHYQISQGGLSHSFGLRQYQDMGIVFSEIRKRMHHAMSGGCTRICDRNYVEFGITCLYSTAQRIEMRTESMQAFRSLAECIKKDPVFWNSYQSAKAEIKVHKRAVCSLLRCGWTGILFRYFQCALAFKKSI